MQSLSKNSTSTGSKIVDMETMPGANWAKRKLHARRDELLETLGKDRVNLVNEANLGRSRTLGGAMDDPIYAQNRDLILAVGEQHVDELLEVETALESIENGSWGSCSECGKLIEADRLMIHPTATQCIQCQTACESSVDFRDRTPSL